MLSTVANASLGGGSDIALNPKMFRTAFRRFTPFTPYLAVSASAAAAYLLYSPPTNYQLVYNAIATNLDDNHHDDGSIAPLLLR